MKLGKDTASLVNHLQSRAVVGQPKPAVGMGCTVLCWTDRHAATITQVFRIGKSVAVELQEDHAKRIDGNGLSELQEYEYTRDPDGRWYVFRRHRSGIWQQVCWNQETKRWNTVRGKGLRLGVRQTYHDFSF